MKEIKNMDLIISKFEGLKKFIYLKKSYSNLMISIYFKCKRKFRFIIIILEKKMLQSIPFIRKWFLFTFS